MVHGGAEVGDFLISARASKSKYLLCDGAAYSRETYADLFAEIGTTFGVGDGSTTFNVPDAEGRVPLVAGSGSGLTARTMGDKGGEETHLLTAAEIPPHNHPLPVGGAATGAGAATNYWQGPGPSSGSSTGNNIGGGSAHNNMPPYIALGNLFIYAGV